MVKAVRNKKKGSKGKLAKKHRRRNYWLNQGTKLKKTVKFKKVSNSWYAIVYLDVSEKLLKKESPVVELLSDPWFFNQIVLYLFI